MEEEDLSPKVWDKVFVHVVLVIYT